MIDVNYDVISLLREPIKSPWLLVVFTSFLSVITNLFDLFELSENLDDSNPLKVIIQSAYQ
jgi:hypothetical protein